MHSEQVKSFFTWQPIKNSNRFSTAFSILHGFESFCHPVHQHMSMASFFQVTNIVRHSQKHCVNAPLAFLNIIGRLHQLPAAWSLSPTYMDNLYCKMDYISVPRKKLSWYLWVSDCFIMTGRKKNDPKEGYFFNSRHELDIHLNICVVYEVYEGTCPLTMME